MVSFSVISPQSLSAPPLCLFCNNLLLHFTFDYLSRHLLVIICSLQPVAMQYRSFRSSRNNNSPVRHLKLWKLKRHIPFNHSSFTTKPLTGNRGEEEEERRARRRILNYIPSTCLVFHSNPIQVYVAPLKVFCKLLRCRSIRGEEQTVSHCKRSKKNCTFTLLTTWQNFFYLSLATKAKDMDMVQRSPAASCCPKFRAETFIILFNVYSAISHLSAKYSNYVLYFLCYFLCSGMQVQVHKGAKEGE